MGHDLRGPLNIILGMSELLLEELDGGGGRETARADLQSIRASGHRLFEIVEALVDLARIEAGDAPVAHVPAEIGPVVEELALDLRASGAQVKVVRESEPALVPVEMKRFCRAVGGLLGALADCGGASGLTVTIAEASIAIEVSAEADRALGLGEEWGIKGEDARILLARALCERMEIDVHIDASAEPGGGATVVLALPGRRA
jgi:signal transduction histidine kinase